MAITITPDTQSYGYPYGYQESGGHKRVPVIITFDNSYASGGESVRVNGSPVQEHERLVGFVSYAASTGGYVTNLDRTNEKLQVFQTLGGQTQDYAPGGGDIKGGTNPAGTEGNADQAAAPTNSALLLAEDTFTNFAGTMTATANPDVPRNVMITIHNDSGGALNLYQGTTTFTITGTDCCGMAQTETVALTSTAGNKSVANTKYRYVQGVKAFGTVTTVTYDNAPAGGLKASLGVGTRIGLTSALATATYTDVLGITVNAAAVAPTATVTSAGGVDTTNNAVNVGTISDGADVSLRWRSAAGQVATGADLSSVVLYGEFIVWG